VGDAGWQTTVPMVEATPFTGNEAHVEVPLDLATFVDLAARIDEESGTRSSGVQVQLLPRFDLATTVGGRDIAETFAPELTVKYDGSTWAVTSELRAEETERIGEDITERVELAGVPVDQVRWLAIPAVVLLALGITIVTVAMRRTPSLTIEALLRRPGISV